MGKALHVCIYASEDDVAAMELTAEMLGMTSKRSSNLRLGRVKETVGNKSALIKVMTAAALREAVKRCTDPELVDEAHKLLKRISPELTGDVHARLEVRLSPCAPRFVSTDGKPMGKSRWEPDPKNPGYDRPAVLR